MTISIDQVDRKIELNTYPHRIVSLVPSQTELLYDLGLQNEVVGITKFCRHPDEWFRSKIKVGGTKQLKLDLITQLQPDLIIGNKEENVKEQIEELSSRFPVWISDVNNLEDAYEMIEKIGEITNTGSRAEEITQKIRQEFDSLKPVNDLPRVAYLIWRNPYMTVGSDTFIHSMLTAAGFKNVFAEKNRYPVVTMEDLRSHNIEFLLLSSEPFPFKERHKEEMQKAFPSVNILLVDGEMFSWYGSRLLQAPAYFQRIAHSNFEF